MRERYSIPIFIFITLIIASTFIYAIKNMDRKNSQLNNESQIMAKDEYDWQKSSKSALTQAIEEKIISKSEIKEVLLAQIQADEMGENRFEEEFMQADEEFQMREDGIAELENRILETIKKEIKKQKKQKDIKETISVDDLDAHIEETKTDRQRLLEDENAPEWFKDGIRGLDYIKEQYGIDMGIAYRGVAQYEAVSENFAGGGNLDLFGRYQPSKSSTIGFNLRSRHTYGPYSSSQYAENIGSLYAVSPSYEERPLFVTELWYQYKLDSFTARLGFVNRNSFIDNSFYKNQNIYFLSSTFSLSPYNALPENGLGLVLKYKKDKYYTIVYVADSDTKKGESLGNILGRDIKLYSALEFGLTQEDAKYYVTLWNRDSQDATKDKNKGAIFSANKMFENNYKVFAKYAFSDSAIEKEHFEFGFGLKDIYREHDLISMAFSVSHPSKDLKTQSTTEIFYRYNIYYGIQLTTSMQVVNHPSKSEENWALLPGVRVRMIF